jgi:hypothetical protein
MKEFIIKETCRVPEILLLKSYKFFRRLHLMPLPIWEKLINGYGHILQTTESTAFT